jgi:glycosyltransferase involved in cell wall biosynthesis
MLRLMQNVWRSGLLSDRQKRSLRPLANQLILSFAGARPALPANLSRGPITLTGFHNDALGIGRAARLTAEGLARAGYDVIRHDVRPVLSDGTFRSEALPGGDGGIWLLHCNPDEAAVAMSRIAPAMWRSKYRIGYWAYELPKAPDYWIRFTRNFHEIWTPSQFVAKSLDGAACPVRVLPHPPPPRLLHVGHRGQRERVRVLAFADMRSSAARKNPLGAVKVFLMAFPDHQTAAELVVKLIRTDADPAGYASLVKAVDGRPDIILVTEELTDNETMQLLADSDVFLSLHRAEGFGLAILEAMVLECAVLATGWSGNLDFMHGMEASLLPYTLTPVDDPSGIYPQGSQWAEPDVGVAVERLRGLVADPDLRRKDIALARANLDRLNQRWSEEALALEPFSTWAKKR